MNSNKLASAHIEHPNAPLAQQPGLANSAWPIVIAIAAALCVMFAVNAWDKRHTK